MRAHRSACGSWLACDANTAVCLLNRRDAIAGKPAPTKVGGGNCRLRAHRSACGSWLACDANTAVCLLNRRDAIAGKPAPTKVGGGIADCARTALPVGAGLPAMPTLRSVC
ncbi:hypothetical protein EU514_08400 [Pseudomonas fragi]|nr:hypothetical protein [Pseudomonas fragi]